MLGYEQTPVVIFNPFSYQELQERLIGLDDYLQCTSTGGTGIVSSEIDIKTFKINCEKLRPSIIELEKQGVSSIAVLSR